MMFLPKKIVHCFGLLSLPRSFGSWSPLPCWLSEANQPTNLRTCQLHRICWYKEVTNFGEKKSEEFSWWNTDLLVIVTFLMLFWGGNFKRKTGILFPFKGKYPKKVINYRSTSDFFLVLGGVQDG